MAFCKGAEMIKYFSKAFKLTNENIILATPLVLFLFLFSIYLSVAQRAPENIVSAILLLVTIVFMVSAFFAGWFYMVKKAVDLDKQEFIIEEDKSKAAFNLIKEFPVGIGEYFFSFIGALIFYVILFVLLAFVAYQLGLHYIGQVGVTLSSLKAALASPVALKSLVASLSTEQLARLNAWNFLFMAVMSIYSFITMFWAVQIVSKTKNPIMAFFKSIKFTFKNFFSALILFVYISFINFTVSLLNAFATMNPIAYFVSMLIYFYFLVYVVVLVFFYYDSQNRPKSEDKSGSGYNCPEDLSPKTNCNQDNCDQSSSNFRADGDGQEQTGDSDSKRD